MAATPRLPPRGILRSTRWDFVLVVLAAAHGAALLAAPSLPLIALGLWWNANVIGHNFIHSPFFTVRELNALFSCYLSLVLGFPLSYWRRRHLQHHAGVAPGASRSRQTAVETGLIFLLWSTLAHGAPGFFFTVYLPGYLLGMGLCLLQGHFEHYRGTTSHYGFVYNLLFFNDGYHVEHHDRPAEHWTRLPGRPAPASRSSRWPPVLRWLDHVTALEMLERLVLRFRLLQRFVLMKHERAFRSLLPHLPELRRVVIVGGGVFPRTALILRRLLPGARLTIVDLSGRSLELARPFLTGDIEVEQRLFDGSRPEDADLVVVPLSFTGDRSRLYQRPPAPAVVVHDWIWARRGTSARVSLLLLKRLNLVRR